MSEYSQQTWAWIKSLRPKGEVVPFDRHRRPRPVLTEHDRVMRRNSTRASRRRLDRAASEARNGR